MIACAARCGRLTSHPTPLQPALSLAPACDQELNLALSRTRPSHPTLLRTLATAVAPAPRLVVTPAVTRVTFPVPPVNRLSASNVGSRCIGRLSGTVRAFSSSSCSGNGGNLPTLQGLPSALHALSFLYTPCHVLSTLSLGAFSGASVMNRYGNHSHMSVSATNSGPLSLSRGSSNTSHASIALEGGSTGSWALSQQRRTTVSFTPLKIRPFGVRCSRTFRKTQISIRKKRVSVRNKRNY